MAWRRPRILEHKKKGFACSFECCYHFECLLSWNKYERRHRRQGKKSRNSLLFFLWDALYVSQHKILLDSSIVHSKIGLVSCRYETKGKYRKTFENFMAFSRIWICSIFSYYDLLYFCIHLSHRCRLIWKWRLNYVFKEASDRSPGDCYAHQEMGDFNASSLMSLKWCAQFDNILIANTSETSSSTLGAHTSINENLPNSSAN